MAILKWDEVSVPNLPDVSQAYARAGEAIDKSFGKLSDGLTTMKQAQKDGASGLLASRAIGYTDIDAYNKALADGSILNGIDPHLLGAEAYAALDQRRNDLLNTKKLESGLKLDKSQLDLNDFSIQNTKDSNQHNWNRDDVAAQLAQDKFNLDKVNSEFGNDNTKLLTDNTLASGKSERDYRSTLSGREATVFDQSQYDRNVLQQAAQAANYLKGAYSPLGKSQREGELANSITDPNILAAAGIAPNPSSLLGLVGKVEAGKGLYGAYNTGTAGDSKGRTLDYNNMTMGQLMQSQSKPKGDADRVFAAGIMQVVPKTLFGDKVDGSGGAYKALGLTPDTKFTPEIQHKVFAYLVGEKQLAVGNYIRGKSDDKSAAENGLSGEFAAFKNASGKGTHNNVGGNAASTSTGQYLDNARKDYAAAKASGLTDEQAFSKAIGIPDSTVATSKIDGDAAKAEFDKANDPQQQFIGKQEAAQAAATLQQQLIAGGSHDIADSFAKEKKDAQDMTAVATAVMTKIGASSPTDRNNIKRILTEVQQKTGNKLSAAQIGDLMTSGDVNQGIADGEFTNKFTSPFKYTVLDSAGSQINMNNLIPMALDNASANGVTNSLTHGRLTEQLASNEKQQVAVDAAREAWKAAAISQQTLGERGASNAEVEQLKKDYERQSTMMELGNKRILEAAKKDSANTAGSSNLAPLKGTFEDQATIPPLMASSTPGIGIPAHLLSEQIKKYLAK